MGQSAEEALAAPWLEVVEVVEVVVALANLTKHPDRLGARCRGTVLLKLQVILCAENRIIAIVRYHHRRVLPGG